MEPFLTQQHLRQRAEALAFARERIAPIAARLDARGRFPWDNVAAMARRGWLGVPAPRALGGMGLDSRSYCVTVEALAQHDASHAITVAAHTALALSPILAFGNQEQRERFVPLLASGKALGGFGLSEPESGSDVASMRTRAVRDGNDYLVSGSKIFITHGGVGEIFVVTCRTGGEGARGLSSFIACKETSEKDEALRAGIGHDPSLPYAQGFACGKREEKLGWRASDTRALFFSGCRIPAGHRLGGEGDGFRNAMKVLDAGRIGIAALSLGIARAALREAGPYAFPGRSAPRPLLTSSQAQLPIAKIATEVDAAALLAYRAAFLRDEGKPYGKEAAMAKLYAAELAGRAARAAMRLIGPASYEAGHPLERMYRDVKACEVGEGSPEIQMIVIARHLMRGPKGSNEMPIRREAWGPETENEWEMIVEETNSRQRFRTGDARSPH